MRLRTKSVLRFNTSLLRTCLGRSHATLPVRALRDSGQSVCEGDYFNTRGRSHLAVKMFLSRERKELNTLGKSQLGPASSQVLKLSGVQLL